MYKKSNRNRVNYTNFNTKKIAPKLQINDKVQKIQETETFGTIKDHKSFPHTLSFCLINPLKSDIGRISKTLLDTINENIQKQTNVNQCKSSSQVIN